MKKNRENIFLDREFIKFYNTHKHEQNNITDLLDGNICRMCVCETEEELYEQFYNATAKLTLLLQLQNKKFQKIKELGY